jgi:hypothetical protein
MFDVKSWIILFIDGEWPQVAAPLRHRSRKSWAQPRGTTMVILKHFTWIYGLNQKGEFNEIMLPRNAQMEQEVSVLNMRQTENITVGRPSHC